eukprot:5621169-Pleurochrysis_carterae.AAC.1
MQAIAFYRFIRVTLEPLSLPSARVRAQGVFAIGSPKTLTSRYAMKEMAAATEDVPGAWAVMTSMARNGSGESPIYAVTHRRGSE